MSAAQAGPPQAGDWYDRRPMIERRLATRDLNMVFIVGMARSGTTWLANLIEGGTGVVRLRETHPFSGYLSSIPHGLEKWREHPLLGIQAICSDDEFLHGVRDLALRTLTGGGAIPADTRVLLEKTPEHKRFLPFIAKVLPDAYILDIVRDPRSVAASWKAAGASGTMDWAKRLTCAEVASRWVEGIAEGRLAEGSFERYRLIRYEDLHSRTAATLLELFQWMGGTDDEAACARIVADNHISKLRKEHVPVTAKNEAKLTKLRNFYRQGLVDGWSNELTSEEVATVEGLAAKEMLAMGYAPGLPVGRSASPPPSAATTDPGLIKKLGAWLRLP